MASRVETAWMKVFGICVAERASEIREERSVAVCIDSFPPFRIAAFPVVQLTPYSVQEHLAYQT